MLMEMKPPDGVVIAAVRRGSHTIVPCGVDKIQAGDTLRVFQTSATSGTITDFLNEVAKKALEASNEKPKENEETSNK